VSDKTGRKQTIHHIAITADSQEAVDKYAEMLKKMVQEHLAVWGEFPKYDYGNYYFLHSSHPENAGDGMEHRNSTVIVQRSEKIEGNELGALGTFSHEFFHSWNVERFRPKTLEPFDFTHSNVSDGLWMAEGFTQYYGGLLLKRAGFRTLEQCIQGFNGIVNTVLTSPGALNYSPIDASRYAVFADAGVAIDQTNKTNIFTSYYTYGASVALALDLRLRANYKLTLDDYMRALWAPYGRPEIPYNVPDLQKTLAALTKDPSFADAFFKQYVYGTAKHDYAALLSNAGLVLRKANPGKAFSGLGRVTVEGNKAVISSTLKGSPAYLAGLDVGDVLLRVAGETIKTQADLTAVTVAHKPGDKIQVTYTHRGISYNTDIILSEDPALEIVTMENAGQTPNATMLDFRNKWLNTQIK
ncbi:MAG: M61 family peptidase, partial [Chitinophagaceae bacterium]